MHQAHPHGVSIFWCAPHELHVPPVAECSTHVPATGESLCLLCMAFSNQLYVYVPLCICLCVCLHVCLYAYCVCMCVSLCECLCAWQCVSVYRYHLSIMTFNIAQEHAEKNV